MEKIDLNNFLEEPTEEGYEMMVHKIRRYDERLKVDEEESIDLDQVISGTEETTSPEKDEKMTEKEEN